jgi:hypothetical protein
VCAGANTSKECTAGEMLKRKTKTSDVIVVIRDAGNVGPRAYVCESERKESGR